MNEAIHDQQRIVAAQLKSIAFQREQFPGGELDAAPQLSRAREAVAQARVLLAALTPDARGEIDAWIGATETQLEAVDVLMEASALLREEVRAEEGGSMGYAQALTVTESNLESSPQRAAYAWDAARQLEPRFRQPRIASTPAIALLLEKHDRLAARVAAELGPRLRAKKLAPQITAATEAIDRLTWLTDRGQHDRAIAARTEVRRAIAVLPDDLDVVTRGRATLARWETDFEGDPAREELARLERTFEPLLERVERAVAARAETRVIEHAPLLAARLPEVGWYGELPRAQRLRERADAVLARIATDVSPACAAEVARADATPSIAADAPVGSRIEAAALRIAETFAEYAQARAAARLDAATEIDEVGGTPLVATERVLERVESAVRDLTTQQGRLETLAEELAALAPAHAAVTAVRDAVPRLGATLRAWRKRTATTCALANAIEEVRAAVERAREATDGAGDDPVSNAFNVWPDALARLAAADEALARAAAIVPDEPEIIDRWRTQIDALRTHAAAALTATCLGEGARLAAENADTEVERFVDALRSALPASPANEQLQRIVSKTAEGRDVARAEIERYGVAVRAAAERTASDARWTYDNWTAERAPVAVLASRIVDNLDTYRGRFVAGTCSHLGLSLADEPGLIDGEIYQIEYDPEVRRQLTEGMAKLDGLFATRATQIATTAGVDGLALTTQHYPSRARFHAEIVGAATYTPRREVRDVHGSLLYTVDGAPYAVPRVAIRAVSTTYYIVVPGQPSNLDNLALVSPG